MGMSSAPGTAAKKQSAVPSPPSAMGRETTLHSGKRFFTCSAMIFAASAAEIVPLNESGATTNFFINILPFNQTLAGNTTVV